MAVDKTQDYIVPDFRDILEKLRQQVKGDESFNSSAAAQLLDAFGILKDGVVSDDADNTVESIFTGRHTTAASLSATLDRIERLLSGIPDETKLSEAISGLEETVNVSINGIKNLLPGEVERAVVKMELIEKSVATLLSSVMTKFAEVSQQNSVLQQTVAVNHEIVLNGINELRPYIESAMKSVYNLFVSAVDQAVLKFQMAASTASSEALTAVRNNVAYQQLLRDTTYSVAELERVTERFEGFVLTAERYSALMSDCLAIQQLQSHVTDLCKVVMDESKKLNGEWSADRAKLYSLMEQLSEIANRQWLKDVILDSVATANAVAGTIQKGIEMNKKEVRF